jgi:hypothetical protein
MHWKHLETSLKIKIQFNMYPNKFFIVILVIACRSQLFAQQFDTIPLREKKILQKPINYNGILYKFPGNICTIIDSTIGSNSGNFNFIRIESSKDTEILYVYSLNSVNEIINKSNRHYLSGDKLIPIVFDSDFRYSDFNFSITDGTLYIEFDKSNWYTNATRIVKLIK